MVRKVLDYCGKFLLSGFTNKSRQFLVELKFDQEIEGLKSLKAKLLSANPNKGKVRKYVVLNLDKEHIPFSCIHVVCSASQWPNRIEVEFLVYCQFGHFRTPAMAIIKRTEVAALAA